MPLDESTLANKIWFLILLKFRSRMCVCVCSCSGLLTFPARVTKLDLDFPLEKVMNNSLKRKELC